MTEQDAAQPLEGESALSAHADLVAARWQTGVGLAIALVAVLLAWGTWQIPSQAHAMDGGARLVPGLCAGALLMCGLWLVWEARHGGWRHAPAFSSDAKIQVTPWVWVSAGILLSGLLMARSGFVVAATLCYVLALQGLRLAAQPHLRVSVQRWAGDLATGALIACLVYALFTQVFGIDLPAGWLAWN